MPEIMRSYQASHPFITFSYNLKELGYAAWLRLGEARSKCQHLEGVPLKPAVSEDLHLMFLTKGVLATTATEGNSMTEEEALARVKGESSLPESREYQGVGVDNILHACDQIMHEVCDGDSTPLNPERIKAWNADVLRDLEVEDWVVPGQVRRESVGVSYYKAAPAEDCEYLLKELCDWLNGPDFTVDKPDLRFPVAVVKAILAHVYLAWIHPFGDGNGRTARLIEFAILVQAGLPSPAAHLLSNHYNLTRDRYYARLAASSKHQKGMTEFIDYALQGFVDGLREQVGLVRQHVLEVTWTNYVHERFHGRNTAAQNRQRDLVLALDPEKPTPIRNVREVTAHIARKYAAKGTKTVTRDLNALEKMNLIRRVPGGIVANANLMLAFLPPRAENAL